MRCCATTASSSARPIFSARCSLRRRLDGAKRHHSRSPEQLPFTNQIQIACDAVKFGVARLSGVDAQKFADDEASLADLRQRIQKTIDFIESVPASRIEGTEAKDVVVPRRDGSMTMRGETYLKTVVLPNFFVHVTTAYALLRHYGVELGKADFLGPMQPAPTA